MKTVGRFFVHLCIYLAAALGLLFIITFLYRFSLQVEKTQYDQNIVQLADQAVYNVSLVKRYIDMSFDVLENFALLFADYDDLLSKDAQQQILDLVGKTEFSILGVSKPDGDTFFSDNFFLNISFREYFR